ncbi:acetyl-CoA synthetase-like protein [Mycena leptocephala]|nr:acetyl-CoA synthetase-like protein [Mycena leptocephala]
MTVLPLRPSAAEIHNVVEQFASFTVSELDLKIPANVTVPQFLLDGRHFARLDHYPNAPWLIDSASGRAITRDELQARTRPLAKALSLQYDLGHDEDPVVCIVSVNHVDYPTTVWASHLLGAAVFIYRRRVRTPVQRGKALLFFVQPEVLSTVREAAAASGVRPDRIILFNTPQATPSGSIPDNGDNTPLTIQDLVDIGNGSDSSSFSVPPARTFAAFLDLPIHSKRLVGIPKLISVSHYAFIANVLQAAVYHAGTIKETIPIALRRYKPGDVSLAVLPFFHILGLLINLHHALFSGMTVVVAPKFSLGTCVKMIEKYQITHLLLVPPMVVLFTKKLGVDVEELRSVRVVSIAGAPLNNELVKRLAQTVPQSVIGQIYGMTEAGALTAPSLSVQVATPGNPSAGASSASVGKLLPGVVWKVIRPDGSPAGCGEKGELWVKTPSMATGYRNNLDSWLRSGDEVYVDDIGELFVVQRLKDFMKVKGFRVNPEELEGQLLKHADVVDCCVVPVPDEFSGEVPKAFIVLTQEARGRVGTDAMQLAKLKAALIQHVAEHKVTYKHLEGGIEFCDEIPKTASGKMLRRLLRDRVDKPTEVQI